METVIAAKISSFLLKGMELTKTEQVKVEFTISMLLVNLSKILIFLSLALVTGTLLPTCLAYFSFLFLRRYLYGYHAMSSFKCGVLTTLHFWLLPLLLQHYPLHVNAWPLLLIYLWAVFFISKYGSLGTELNPVAAEKRGLLKLKALLVLSLIFIGLLRNVFGIFENCVLLGVLIAVTNILPLTKKIYQIWGN